MLETTWFILWGLLWAIYFMLDGYDFGVGMLLPSLGKTEDERRTMVNSVGPLWDGNEVWLITAGGVTFAAFPRTYATMFSTLYTPLMLLLFALIFRGVAFEFRSKVDSAAWRRVWDACLVVGSFLPSFLLGVTFANLFQGVPLDDQGLLQGNTLTLLNPYGILGGVTFVFMFLLHGALWLGLTTEGVLGERAHRSARILWPLTVVLVLTLVGTSGWATPLFDNYMETPALWLIPVLSVGAYILAWVGISRRKPLIAWGSSCVGILFAALWGVAGLYPNLLPSNLDPRFSLTAFNSASSPLTLKLMLTVALIMVPVVIAYQTWVHLRFGRPAKPGDFSEGSY